MSLFSSCALYRVVISYMVAGLLVDSDGIVRYAPPIMRWSIGKQLSYVRSWVVNRRGGSVDLISNPLENEVI